MTLAAISAAVLGGVGFLGGQGTMRGALAGSLLMSILISVMFFLRLPLVAQYIVQGLIIVVTVALPLIRASWRRTA
jgi:ribose transport system permease protein